MSTIATVKTDARKGKLTVKKAQAATTIPSCGNVIETVLGVCNIIFIDYLDKGKTISGKYYANLLQHLNQEKTPQFTRKKVLFYQDNATTHTSIVTLAKIKELQFILLTHLPHSSDLVHSDFNVFPNRRKKKWLGEKRFVDDSETNDAVRSLSVWYN